MNNTSFAHARPSHSTHTLRSTLLRTAIVLCGTLATSAFATDWWVDGANGNDHNRGNQSAPFQTVDRAWSAVRPGDTIHLQPTTTYGPLYFSGKSGNALQYITITGEGVAPNLTKVSGKGINFGIDFEKGVNYIKLKNLDITAPGAGQESGWSGVYLTQNHHIQILNNYVHDAGCSGIQTASSDYVTIAGNRVTRNAKLTTNNVFCSGISTHENLNSDASTGVKMQILNNIVYANTNVPLATCTSPCTDSDGSGIIVDDSRRTQTDRVAYRGKTLIGNNVVFGNGGRGIHVYLSDNVQIMSNTLYQNNKDPYEGSWRPGEISIIQSGGINIYNNILFSDGAAGTVYTGAHTTFSVEDCTSGGAIVIDYNVTYNSPNNPSLQAYFRNNTVPVTVGTSNKWADPLFKSASLDPAQADFRVTTASPALGFTNPSGTYMTTDILGVTRQPPITAGAYQQPVN